MSLAILRLIGLATLAVVGVSLGPVPVAALSLDAHNFARHEHAARHGMLYRRQSSTPSRKRCKARPSALPSGISSTTKSGSSSTATHVQAPAPTTTTTKATLAPQVTTTKAAAPSPTLVTTSGGSRKVGIVYVGPIDVPRFVSGSTKVAGVYNWSVFKPSFMSQIPNIAFTPMLWGPSQEANFPKFPPGFATTILAMNEPDQAGQSNISPQAGVDMWRQFIQPLKAQGYTLISPAPTNAPSGQAWLGNFIAACTGCDIDRVALHFYGTDAEAFISHLEAYSAQFKRPLWVTEYACQDFSGQNNQCSTSQVAAFMDRTTSYMDQSSSVEMYFWFGVLNNQGMNNVNLANQLINSDSSPNALGRKYLGLA